MSTTSHDPARTPAESFPPGDYIAEELEARGWTQTDLAEILGRPLRLVNELLNGKRSISPETARGLGEAFGTSAEMWMNLESAFQLSKVRTSDDAVARKARLYAMAPIKDMVRRGWLESSSSVETMEQQVLSFFHLRSLDQTPEIKVAARAKATGPVWSPAQTAWFFRARQVASAVDAARYSPSGLDALLARLRELATTPEDVRHVPRVMAEAGIRFVVVEDLPGTKIDGACQWISKTAPVVAVSLRIDYIDSFWHTVMHELGHVSKGPATEESLDVDLAHECGPDQAPRPQSEIEADQFACEHLVPQGELEDFIRRTRPLYARTKVEAFAARWKIHPGIVLGQLKHRGEIEWRNLVVLHAKVRSTVVPAALSDGYGNVVPVPLS